jgi:hypothetical protein
MPAALGGKICIIFAAAVRWPRPHEMRPYRKSGSARSYWLNASNFYVLSVAIAMAVFVLMMGLMRDERDEAYIPAGVAASAVLVLAVIVRRAILNKSQMRAYATRQLEHNLNLIRRSTSDPESKLTIEKNASILRELKRKSDAANVLARYPDGHREVFELCGQYLEINARELPTVNPGSPRIAALRKGRAIAEDFHRRHMLKWVEIETKALLEKARTSNRTSEKISLAGDALAIIESATAKYPADDLLLESASAIAEFVIKAKVSDLIDRAGRAETRGNPKLAEKHFLNALIELEKSDIWSRDRELALARIKSELERLSGPV